MAGFDIKHLIMVAIVGAATFLWGLQGRVAVLEENFKFISDDIKELNVTNKEILASVRNVEKTRFTPKDFQTGIATVQQKMDDIDSENGKQWERLSNLERQLNNINLELQKALISKVGLSK